MASRPSRGYAPGRSLRVITARLKEGETSAVEQPPRQAPTELIDLSDISIAELRDCDERIIAPSRERILRQINRPRGNISESGPPGRVD